MASGNALPSQVLPIEPKNLLEVAGDLRIVEDQAGVPINQGALVGPVMAAEEHSLPVDDDSLGVAAVLKADLAHIETSLLHLFERPDRGEIAPDDDSEVHA